MTIEFTVNNVQEGLAYLLKILAIYYGIQYRTLLKNSIKMFIPLSIVGLTSIILLGIVTQINGIPLEKMTMQYELVVRASA